MFVYISSHPLGQDVFKLLNNHYISQQIEIIESLRCEQTLEHAGLLPGCLSICMFIRLLMNPKTLYVYHWWYALRYQVVRRENKNH